MQIRHQNDVNVIRSPTRLYPTAMARRSPRQGRKPKLPRAPLPKQTEQTHEDKSKRPFRKEKYKKKWLND
jgi:hypothetical protein